MQRREFLESVVSAPVLPASILLASGRFEGLVGRSFTPSKPLAALPPNWGCIHYQWEFPAWVPDAGKHFDMRAYVSGLLESGVEAVHVLTVAEPGVFHYDTKIGFERDPSGRDWLRETLDEIRRQGAADRLKVVAYYTVSWNNSAAKHRPEWQQVNRVGRPVWDKDVFGQNRWAYMCINSPYRDYQFAMLKEIVDNYTGIAAFWFDEPLFPEYSGQEMGCYCKWCEEQFRAQYGVPLPRQEDEARELWLKMKHFQVESLLRYFQDFEKRVLINHPEIAWTWNGQSAPCDWEPRLWKMAPFNSHEVQEGYLMALMWAKRFASYKRPFELTLGNDYSWVDQRIRPAHELKTFQAIAVAHGGGVLIGDYPYPDGRFREHKLDWCKELFHWKGAISDWLQGAENFSEVALFESYDANLVRYVRETKPGQGRPTRHAPSGWDLPMFGWLRLLSAANYEFDVINEDALGELARYKLVILPDRLHLSETTVEALREYVTGGGHLLATFRTGLYDAEGKENPSPALWELFGLKFRGFSPYRGNYIRIIDNGLKAGLHPMPLLVLGTAVVAETATAKPLAYLTYPIGELKPETRVWFDYNPPRRDSSPHPSVSLNQWGKGQALYVAHPVEERHLRGSYWALGKLLLNAAEFAVPEKLIRIGAPAEIRAIVTTQRDKRRVILHLLNEADWTATAFLTTEGSQWAQKRVDSWFTNQSPWPWKREPVPNVEISLRLPFGSVGRVYQAPDRTPLAVKMVAGRAGFTVPRVDTHTVVVVEE